MGNMVWLDLKEWKGIPNEEEAWSICKMIQATVAKNKNFSEVYDTEPRCAILAAIDSSWSPVKCPAPGHDDQYYWGMFSEEGARAVGEVVRKVISILRASHQEALKKISTLYL